MSVQTPGVPGVSTGEKGWEKAQKAIDFRELIRIVFTP
jgi:hypothetical protein